MKTFVLIFLIWGPLQAQSNPISKNINKSSGLEWTKTDLNQIPTLQDDATKVKESRIKITKIDDSKLESYKDELKLKDEPKLKEKSKLKNLVKVKNELKLKDELELKDDLKLEIASDSKPVDRVKKACKTLAGPTSPTKICFEVTPGVQNLFEVCKEDISAFENYPNDYPENFPTDYPPHCFPGYPPFPFYPPQNIPPIYPTFPFYPPDYPTLPTFPPQTIPQYPPIYPPNFFPSYPPQVFPSYPPQVFPSSPPQFFPSHAQLIHPTYPPQLVPTNPIFPFNPIDSVPFVPPQALPSYGPQNFPQPPHKPFFQVQPQQQFGYSQNNAANFPNNIFPNLPPISPNENYPFFLGPAYNPKFEMVQPDGQGFPPTGGSVQFNQGSVHPSAPGSLGGHFTQPTAVPTVSKLFISNFKPQRIF